MSDNYLCSNCLKRFKNTQGLSVQIIAHIGIILILNLTNLTSFQSFSHKSRGVMHFRTILIRWPDFSCCFYNELIIQDRWRNICKTHHYKKKEEKKQQQQTGKKRYASTIKFKVQVNEACDEGKMSKENFTKRVENQICWVL